MSRSAQVGPSLFRGHSRGQGARRALRLILLPVIAVFLFYLVWPYATLWRLERSVVSGNLLGLEGVVDLAAVRAEIRKKLNKDADSNIGALSDPFIRWLEAGIQEAGSGAVDRLVTLGWVRGQLLAHGDGVLAQISYAFFDSPDGFRITLGPADGLPVQVRLTLHDFAWRVSAVYY